MIAEDSDINASLSYHDAIGYQFEFLIHFFKNFNFKWKLPFIY